MKQLNKNELFWSTGNCRHCIYSIYFAETIDEFVWKCARFPAWTDIDDVDAHYCGEWKEYF